MRAAVADGLYERQVELAALSAALHAAGDGVGGVVVVEGAAGLGKTRLLACARAEARSVGLRVLGARGSELERRVPFGIVRQLLDPVVLGAAPEQRTELFDGAAELAQSIFGRGALIEASGADDDIFPKLHGLHWLLSNLARECPLALLVDDAQWSDEPSLHLLAYLARRVEDLPLVAVIGTRPVAATADSLLARVVTDPVAQVLRPRPLSCEAVAACAAAALGREPAPGFVAACHDASRGNPFLVFELLREVGARGLAPTEEAARVIGDLAPGGVVAVVMLRLAALPPGSTALAEAVAVLGDGAATSDAAALAGAPAPEAAASVAALVRDGTLEHQRGLAFAHPVVRAAVYEGIPPPERDRLHREAGALLAARGAPVEEVAAHFLAAEPAGEQLTVAVLRQAAARAVALGVPGSAVAYLERALAEPPPPEQRADLLVELGTAAARAGAARAIAWLREAVELAPDAETRSRAALELARAVKYGRGGAEVLDVLERCLRETSDPAVAEVLELELLGLAIVSRTTRARLGDRLAAQELPAAGATGARAAFALAALGFELVRTASSSAEAGDLVARAMEAARPGDPAVDFLLLVATITASWSDRAELAQEVSGRLMDEARRVGSARLLSGAASLRAYVHQRAGRLADAEADAGFALELAREVHGTETLLSIAKATAALVAVERAGPEELARLLDALGGDDRDSLPFAHVIHARGSVLAALGRPGPALEEFLLAGQRHTAWGAVCPAYFPWRSDAALALSRLDRDDEALELADAELALARRFGAATCVGIALRARALVGLREEAEPYLHEAVAVLETSPAQLELARALVDLGSVRRRAGDRTAARVDLRRGAALAVRCGAQRLSTRAHEEMLASGARPRRIALKGVESLTPSERRVAELAAAGSTNRQIAQELFVTEKTVEGHLARVFDKLGVRSRTVLPQALHSRPAA